eukprot:TCONS_00055458-protein
MDQKRTDHKRTDHKRADHKKTWAEIDKAVYKSRVAQCQLATFVPSNFTFYKSLVIFLGVPPGDSSNENTLIYVDIENGAWENMDVDCKQGSSKKSNDGLEAQSYTTYHWNFLLDPETTLSSSTMGYSKEEELLRERKRLVSHGITSYDFDHKTGRLLFRSGSDIYTVDVAPITTGATKFAAPRLVSPNMLSSKMDSKICPSNTNIISFIESGDIWVSNIITGHEMRLTFVRNAGRDDSYSAGEPSYVTQEEFDRFTGYWWEPFKQQDMEGCLEVHKILYELVDQHAVEELHIPATPDNNFSSFVETYRYPKAGSMNAKSTLRLVQFCIKSSTNEFLDGSIVEYELRNDLQELFPWAEYIVRCGWMPDGKHIWVKVLNRAQNHMALLRIPCSAFRPITMNNIGPSDVVRQHKIDVLLEEHSDYWINVTDILWFLPTLREERLSIIFISEESRFKHLNFVTVTTDSDDGYFGISNEHQPLKECVIRHCQLVEKKELTSGQWEVKDEKVDIDNHFSILYIDKESKNAM